MEKHSCDVQVSPGAKSNQGIEQAKTRKATKAQRMPGATATESTARKRGRAGTLFACWNLVASKKVRTAEPVKEGQGGKQQPEGKCGKDGRKEKRRKEERLGKGEYHPTCRLKKRDRIGK